MRIPRRHLIDQDDVWPVDEEHRYRLYARRGDRDLDVLAAASSMEAIGLAIKTLHEDERDRGRRLCDLGVIGILDTMPDRDPPGPTGEWIVPPWQRGGDTR